MSDPVAKVSADLRAIAELAAALADQAEHRANDRLMPGGVATVSLANVANQEAHIHQLETIERLWAEARAAGKNVGPHPDPFADDDDTWEPPLQTLTFWSERWRTVHAMEYDVRPTLASETNFIRWALEWAWENEANWDRFAADVRSARLRIENILYAGRRPERTEVPCIEDECERRPKLIKVWADAALRDHYKCPACKTKYEHDRFIRAKHQLLASQTAETWVRARDAREHIARPERTFTKWVTDGDVRTSVVNGVRWVWWPDVRDMDLMTPRRQRRV